MINFPTSIDDDSTLFAAVNNLRTRLVIGIDEFDTTLQVITTSGFPSAGYITILSSSDITKAEAIKYDTINATQFVGVTRGAGGTTAVAHIVNDDVDHTIVADHHNELKDAVIALETFTGTDSNANFVFRNFSTGDALVDGSLTVSGVAELQQDLTVSGMSTLGAISVSGTSSLTDDVDMKQTLTVSGTAAFGQPPAGSAITIPSAFDDTTGTTTSTTNVTVMTSPVFGSGEHLLLYRGNTGIDSSSSTAAGIMEIRALFAGSEIAFGAQLTGDDSGGRKDGHGDASEIAGFKMVESAGGIATIEVKSAGTTTLQYGALAIVAIPLGGLGLVNGEDYWTYDSGNGTRESIITDGWSTKDVFMATVPDDGKYLLIASVEGFSTREIGTRYRLNGSLIGTGSSVGTPRYTPFPNTFFLDLLEGSNTIAFDQIAGFQDPTTATTRRSRMILIRSASFSQMQSIDDTLTQATSSNSFAILSDYTQVFTPIVQQSVLAIGITHYETASDADTTTITYKIENTTDAEETSIDAGMPLFNTGSGSNDKSTMVLMLLEDIVSSKTLNLLFRNLTDNGKTSTNTAASFVIWGLGAPVAVTDVPITTIDGNAITTHEITTDDLVTGTAVVSGDATVSGALAASLATIGDLTTVSGAFSTSLTLSGVPVSTGTDTNLQEAYVGGTGIITTVGGKDFTLDGTGAITAVTGTFTDGITVGTASTILDNVSITTGSGIFTDTLTVSGIPVNLTGGGSSLTVRETDSSPTVNNVTTIVVTTGTLTDDGGGQVTIDTGGGGGGGGGGSALTIRTPDSDPSVSDVSEIVVASGSLTDNGTGQVTIGPLPKIFAMLQDSGPTVEIGNGFNTLIAWDIIAEDTDGQDGPSGLIKEDLTAFVIPAHLENSWWVARAQVAWDNVDTELRAITLFGVPTHRVRAQNVNNTAIDFYQLITSNPFMAPAGTELDVRVTQLTGGNVNILSGAGEGAETWFSLERVGISGTLS